MTTSSVLLRTMTYAIKFLRAREVVHYQRFGECLRITQDKLDSRNFYAFNPEFDMHTDPCQQ